MMDGNLTKSRYDSRNLFRVINVRYIHSARKNYDYYGGRINIGQSYYRGFGVRAGIPFEFFFTEDLIFERRAIKSRILESEYEDYWTRRYMKEMEGK